MPGGTGRMMGKTSTKQEVSAPGRPGGDGRGAAQYAREGIGHVQLVIDPITRASIKGFAPALRYLEDD